MEVTPANFEYLKGIAEAAVGLSAWIEVWEQGAEERGIPFPEELSKRHKALKVAIAPNLDALYAMERGTR